MNRFLYRTGNDNTGFTVVENIFINEYIPEAKGDYVKVYLFGLKNSQNPELEPLSTGELARILDLTESDILKALEYWESKKLIRLEETGPDRNIVFMNIASMMHYPEVEKKKAPVYEIGDERFKQMVDTVQNMMGGEPLSFQYLSSLKQWTENYGFDPETVILLVEHALTSMERNGKTYNRGARLSYMEKTAESWKKAGIKTYQQAEAEIQGHKQRSKFVYAFLKEMRISGNATESDLETINKWKKDLGFSEEMIMAAAKKAQVKRINYVNSILYSWHNQGFKSPEDIVHDVKPYKKKNAAEETPEDQQRSQALADYEQASMDWFYRQNTDEEDQ
ncbi:MAG: DnaD domain protein [Eubacteriaceae bacterium]|jgi:DnaD/phage-associated family protein